MSMRSFGIVLTALLMMTGAAFADSFYFVSPPPGVDWQGVYVNPYQANDNTNPQNNPLTIYCDDWDTEFSGNPTWNANVYALNQLNVPNLKFGAATQTQSVSYSSGQLHFGTNEISANAYDLYLEAVYLDQQMQTLGGGITPTQQEELSAAEWTLFTGSGASTLLSDINNSGSTFAQTVYNYLTAAQTAVANNQVDATGWDVITPTNNTFAMQEFLVDNGPNVPEPSAIILLGTVAGLLGWKRFRHGRARQA